MQTEFQIQAHRALAEFAQVHQLGRCPLVESGNGVAYKRNDTVFTVYHDRLDDENDGRIELAIGVENIAAELSCTSEAVAAWLSETRGSFHPAERKPPLRWPRLSAWSVEEVQHFCRAFQFLLNSKNAPESLVQGQVEKPAQAPPVDERVMREILSRRGQAEFRAALLQAYGGRCAISGCADIAVLEAAHITPHSEKQDYRPANGILLRADLHTLFDLRLLSVDPRSAKAVVSRHLGTTYQDFNHRVVNLPVDAALQPDASSLMRHFTLWQAGEKSVG